MTVDPNIQQPTPNGCPTAPPFTLCVWLGAGFGALLASSRLRGWFVALYSLVLSLAASGQAVGVVVLPQSLMKTMPFWEILRVMNVRILTFCERAGGWVSAIASGTSVVHPIWLPMNPRLAM